MTDYRVYLDNRFHNPQSRYLTRERLTFLCPICSATTILTVANVKARIDRFGDYKCRSCAGKDVWNKCKEGIIRTLEMRYGVSNPKQIKKENKNG